MNNNINTLLNSLSNLGEIRKADKNIGEYSSESDFTMAVGTKRKIYHYFPKNKQKLQEIIAQRILKDGYECNLNDIDIRGAGEYMNGLFLDSCILGNFWSEHNIDMKKFNGHIEDWDVSNVEDMGYMFSGCSKFDQDISGWDVSNVVNMYAMFGECSNFDQDISGWDVSNVEDMRWMFYGCSKFNQNLSGWNVSNVENKNHIFASCPIKEKYKPKFNY